jgi:hypothetical protein
MIRVQQDPCVRIAQVCKKHRIQVLDSFWEVLIREDLKVTVSFNYFTFLYLLLPIAHIN